MGAGQEGAGRGRGAVHFLQTAGNAHLHKKGNRSASQEQRTE